jgi:hypothetical protein
MIRTPYWGRWALHEASLFVGVAPAVLAVWGVASGERRTVHASLAMALVALVVAFGNSTPLFAFLYGHLPGFRSVRVVARLTFLTSLFVAMLAAVGLDRLLRTDRRPRWLAIGALATGVVLMAAGGALVRDCSTGGHALWEPALRGLWFFDEAFQRFVLERAPESAAACRNAGVSSIVGGTTFTAVGLLLLAARRRPACVWVVALIGVVELLTYARYSRRTFDSAPLVARSDAVRRLSDEAGAGEARVASAVPYFYVALAAGVPDVWAGADLVLGRYARFIAFTQQWPVDAILVTSTIRRMSPLLGMLRLRHALLIDGDEVRLVATHLRELPRAALIPRWKVLPAADQVLDALGDPAFDPAREVLLETDPGLVPALAGEPGSVSVVDVSTDEIDVRADVPAPAVLLLTDNYSTGWKARALPGSTDQPYRVLPADYTLRAIPLSPGRHHFRLEYRPLGFVIGRWVTVVSLATYAGAAIALLRRRRRRAPARARA